MISLQNLGQTKFSYENKQEVKFPKLNFSFFTFYKKSKCIENLFINRLSQVVASSLFQQRLNSSMQNIRRRTFGEKDNKFVPTT
jgi:hypothetical protein